ncbi:condensation domain-containing protein, partial [Catenulispora pinistramenti]|uniref:condensation domain-containing protein n=1 Tax=Catenulispora pinistramenti TaxID=2705254 RepID=UPI001E285A15
MRLVNRVRGVFGVEVAIRDLFDRPTIQALARHIENGAGGSTRSRIEPAQRPSHPPLSSAQRRLHFLNCFDGPSAVYNVPVALRLVGALDVQALRAALRDVVGRHESLRTVFPDRDGEPYQRVLDVGSAAIELTVADIAPSDLDGAVQAASGEPFGLAEDLPIRARVWRVGPDEHVLLLVVHHIATDGWSQGPLLRDLTQAYDARVQGSAPGFAPLPVQYADFALWQADRAADQRDLEFWAEQLRGVPEETVLPLDRPRPVVRSQHGAQIRFDVDQDTHAELQALAQGGNATLFMVLHAAVATVLHRYGAGTDIAVGTAVAGRSDHALDDLVGFFVNTLVLRTDLSGNPDFQTLIERVRDADLRAYAHQDIPFEELVAHLAPVRTPARHPLFQVMLSVDQTDPVPPALSGLTVENVTVPTDTAKFDLALVFQPNQHPDGTPAGITIQLTYATDIFNPNTIEALTHHLSTLLTDVTRNPHAPLRELEMTTVQERAGLLEWGAGPAAVPSSAGLAERFALQVRRTPDAVAVEAADGTAVTYAELDARSDQLAWLLRAAGAGPERFVAVAMGRSVDLVVAFLAVVKAGAAYVPLPAAYPLGLALDVVRDMEPVVLLTDVALRDSEVVCGIAEAGLPVLTVDALEDAEYQMARGSVDGVGFAGLDQVAYVMFTSGSTGVPKGVSISQRNVLALVDDGCWRGGRHSRVLMHSPHSFDAVTYEMWVPLLAGGTVVLFEDGLLDLAGLERVLVGRGVTGLYLTKALFDVAVAEIPGALGCVSEVWTGGEEASVGSVNRAAVVCPGLSVVNVWGPTETTVFATFQVTGGGVPFVDSVPVGV